MSNCLFEAAYERVLRECECLPSFHAPIEAVKAGYNDTCKGPSLACMKRILGLLGKLNTVRQPGGFFWKQLVPKEMDNDFNNLPNLIYKLLDFGDKFGEICLYKWITSDLLKQQEGAMAPKPSVLRFLFVCCISNFVILT